jgi:hypothetical protein
MTSPSETVSSQVSSQVSRQLSREVSDTLRDIVSGTPKPATWSTSGSASASSDP